MKGWYKKRSHFGSHYCRRRIGFWAQDYSEKALCNHQFFCPEICSEDVTEVEALWGLIGHPFGSGNPDNWTLLYIKADFELTDEQMNIVRQILEKQGPREYWL